MTRRAPRKKARRSIEHASQVAVMCHAAMRARTDPLWSLLFAIPNGGARDPITGAILKAEGVKPGVPDLCLPVANGEAAALYIEMKAPKGKPSPHQLQWHRVLQATGNAIVICQTAAEALNAIEKHLNPHDQAGSQILQHARELLKSSHSLLATRY